MEIKIFTPSHFDYKELNIEELNKLTNKNWIYTANGRSSIYHILKSLNIDKILIPTYICSSVLEPLNRLSIKPIFYDLDLEDLNPSLESIKLLSKKYKIKAVLVASMYGNPANLVEIEKYCIENNIFMIDDAAQSFGAKLGNRFVGTFGNAGFFSFSPGKPTAGHMGSFFWSNIQIDIKRRKHLITHYIKWLDFYVNRYKIYIFKNKIFKKFTNLYSRFLFKFVDVYNDDICKFEYKILGGILYNNLNNKLNFRNYFVEQFYKLFKDSRNFRVLKNIRKDEGGGITIKLF